VRPYDKSFVWPVKFHLWDNFRIPASALKRLFQQSPSGGAPIRNFLKGFEHCLIYLDYPEPRRSKLKTNNPIVRAIEELNRRLIPMRSFNNTRSIQRIAYGLVAYVLNQHQVVRECLLHKTLDSIPWQIPQEMP